jgi:ribosome-associated protein
MQWRFTGSGGPGGQHANTSNTRVELVWDVRASEVLTDAEREILLEEVGPTLRVVVSDARSQARNRELAVERLHSRITDALTFAPPRKPTRPTKASKQRRLEAKRRQSLRKQERRDQG